MKAYAVTDVGRTRDTNQDYFYYSSEPVGNLPNLYLVADGMGGHKAGDLASRFTIENVVRLVESYKDYRDPVTILAKAINEVNGMLIEKSKESEDYEGMGTTLVAATIDGDVLKVANVGDSRLYLIEKDILQITRDHSLVEDMVRMGMIEKEEARNHYKKNVITKAIGVAEDKTSTPDIFEIEISRGDKLLLCSDGLTNMVEDYEMKKIIVNNDSIEEAVRNLISQANENGGKDNISAILIEPEVSEE